MKPLLSPVVLRENENSLQTCTCLVVSGSVVRKNKISRRMEDENFAKKLNCIEWRKIRFHVSLLESGHHAQGLGHTDTFMSFIYISMNILLCQ